MMVIGGSAAQPTKAAQSAELIYSAIVGVLRYWPSWVVTATAIWFVISDVALNPIWYRFWGLIDYQACR